MEEIELLTKLIEKAKLDYVSVSVEERQLEIAKDYVVSNGASAELKSEMMSKTYNIVINAQNTIWEKVYSVYSELDKERNDALMLISQLDEITLKREFKDYENERVALNKIEGRYQGKITMDSFGNLWDARTVYMNIMELKKYFLMDDLLDKIVVLTPIEQPRCNEEIMMSKETTIWNP